MRPTLLTGVLGLALSAGASLLATPKRPSDGLGRAEAALHDLVFTLAGPAPLGPLPVLVDIDQATLGALRRPLVTYPPLLARCTRNLVKRGFQRVVIDLNWRLDPGHNLGGANADRACQPGGAKAQLTEDDALAELVCAHVREAAVTFLDPDLEGRVAFATVLRAETGRDGQRHAVFDRPPHQWCGQPGCEALANLAVDAHDGVVRRYDYNLISRAEAATGRISRPSVASFLADPAATSLATEWLRPADQPPRRASFMDCLRDDLGALAPRSERTALIAACAAPLMDRHALIAAGTVCGAEVHLVAAATATAGAFVRPAPLGLRWLAAALASLGVALGLKVGRGPGIALGTLAAVGALLIALPLAVRFGYLIPPLPALLVPLATGIVATATRLTSEARAKRRLATAVRTYLPRPAVNRILERLDAGVLEGETVVAAVLFSDIANYTSIAERLTPAGTIALLNRHFQHLTDAAVAQGGWIEGYVGDQVVAYWPAIAGTDISTPEEASRRAFAAATSIVDLRGGMVEALDEVIRVEMVKGDRGDVLAHIRKVFGYGIGVHTGPVVLGDMGSVHLKKFGIIGDTMNTTSRIESLTRKFGASLLLGEGAARYLPAQCLRPLVSTKLKGRGEAVMLFESAKTARPAGFDAALLVWCETPQRFEALLTADPALAADPLLAILLRNIAQAPVLRFDDK